MSRNNGLICKINKDFRLMGLERLLEFDRKTHLLFLRMVPRCDGDVFLANNHRETLCSQLKMSKATYFRKIKKLQDGNLLMREGPSVYRVNREYFNLLKEIEKAEEALKNKQRREDYWKKAKEK